MATICHHGNDRHTNHVTQLHVTQQHVTQDNSSCTDTSSQTTTIQLCKSIPTENLPALSDNISDRQDTPTDSSGRQTATVSSQTEITSFQDTSDTEVGCCGIKRRKKSKEYTLLKKKDKSRFGKSRKKEAKVLVSVENEVEPNLLERKEDTESDTVVNVAVQDVVIVVEDVVIFPEDVVIVAEDIAEHVEDDKTSQTSLSYTEDTSEYTVSKCECMDQDNCNTNNNHCDINNNNNNNHTEQNNFYPKILTNQYVPTNTSNQPNPFNNHFNNPVNHFNNPVNHFNNPVNQLTNPNYHMNLSNNLTAQITNHLANYSHVQQITTKCPEDVLPAARYVVGKLPARPAMYDISGLVYNVGTSVEVDKSSFQPARPISPSAVPRPESPPTTRSQQHSTVRCCKTPPESPDISETIQVSERVSVAIPSGPWIVNGSGSPFRGGLLAASRTPPPRQYAVKTRQRLRIVAKCS